MQTPVSSSVTRRHFIKSSSTAASLALLGTLSLERAVHAASGDMLKIALIGCGGRGSGAASQVLETGNVKLVAIADPFESQITRSLEQLRKLHPDKVEVPKERQFTRLDGYKDAIAAADVVLLAAPPGFRPDHFDEAVKQGKHTFMEKPLAVDAPGVRQLLVANEIAKKKNLRVAVGFQRHHKPHYLEAVKRIHDGELGDIMSLRVYWRGGARGGLVKEPGESEMAYQLRNWYFFTYLSGDHIVEQHCHNIDVGNWIKGAHPIRAHGVGGRQVRTSKEHGQIFDHHYVEFEYEDGTRMHSESTQIPHLWNTVSEHVHGTKGMAELKDGGALFTGAKAWRKKSEVNGWQQEQTDFIAAIRKNEKYNEVESSAISTMTAIMGRMATYSGKMIEWDEAYNSELVLMPKNLSLDSPAPVQPDADGNYPVAVPGRTVAL